MSRSPQSEKPKNQKSKSSAKSGAQKAPQRRKSLEEPRQEKPTGQLIDDSTKRDIAGVVFIILAIAFMLIVAMPSGGAIVSDVASNWIHLILGIGSYIFPFVLAAIGITFLYRTREQRVPARAAIGLSIIFIALLGFIALFTPISVLGADEPDLLFLNTSLISYGGYIGASIAWVGITMLGHVVTGTILVGIMIVGILIVGFSISKTIELVKKKKRERDERLATGEEGPSPFKHSFARVRRKAEPEYLGAAGEPLFEQEEFRRALQDGQDGITRPLFDVGAHDRSVHPAMRRLGSRKDLPQTTFRENNLSVVGKSGFHSHGYTGSSVRPLATSVALPVSKAQVSDSQVFGNNKTIPLMDIPQYEDDEEKAAFEFIQAEIENGTFGVRDPYVKEAARSSASIASQAIAASPVGRPFDMFNSDEEARYAISNALPGNISSAQDGGDSGAALPELEKEFARIPLSAALGPLAIIDSIRIEDGPSITIDDGEGDADVPSASDVVIYLDDEDEAADSSASSKPKRASVKKKSSRASSGETRGGYTLPSPSLLTSSKKQAKDKSNDKELAETAERLQQTLADFGIMASVVGWIAGPTVTLFKVDLPSGVRVSRITALNDDIALALAAPGVRIFAPIPGTNHVGIEVPNSTRESVLLADVLGDAPDGPLQIAIGKDVEGNSIVSDLAKMPHLLIGGTTGSGKSVSINAMIMSILMRATPDEVRFIMIDPKRVEFTPYNGIPHLYVPVVTEPREAASALSWGVAEMERRLKMFSKVGARNIAQYNAKVVSGELTEEDMGDESQPATDGSGDPKELPYIVIIIDELADLMMNVGKEVEFSISRIAQLARAAGIHLIVATQRPSTNVVTGLIKANITNRIAFNVASGIDSRVILDTPGAENLIGLGDLLLSKPELAKPQRIQGCYVSEDEIFSVVEHAKSQSQPDYHTEILQTNVMSLGDTSPNGGSGGDDDPLLWEAAEIVVSSNMGSTSNIQRRLKVGYARAGRIMDQLEEKGIVGPANGSKPREVLVDEMELETLNAFESQGN